VVAALAGPLLLASCGAVEEPVEQRPDLALLLPAAPELEGWRVCEGPTEHSPGTLYEYLDGGADRYLGHGFTRLLHVRYQHGDDPLACVTLDVYDMASELGAFGIYSAARSPEAEVRAWGVEGYLMGTVAAAWRGPVYVHGEADDERDELIAMLERLVAGAGDRAPGDAVLPPVLAPLPRTGRVERSERYVPAALLGHSFLPGGVLAAYEVDGRRAELYLSDLGRERAAAEALAALRDHLAQWGTVEEGPIAIGAGGFRYTDPTLGSGAAVTSGRFVAGMHGELPAQEQDRILGELVTGLEPH
jgi:hypothetical protein